MNDDPIFSSIPNEMIKQRHASVFIGIGYNDFNKIISCGGLDWKETINSKCIFYDHNYFRWTYDPKIVPNMHIPRADATATFAFGQVFVIGGFDGSKVLNTMEIYNPYDRKWKLVGMNVARSRHCSIQVNDAIYVSGGILGVGRDGQFASRISSNFMKYNLSTNKWSNLPDMPLSRRNHACVFDENLNGIIISGGVGNNDQTMDSVCFFNTTTNEWEGNSLPAMNEPRAHHGVTILNKTPVVLGGTGSRHNHLLKTVEKYDQDKWLNASFQLKYARTSSSLVRIDMSFMLQDCQHNEIPK